MAQIMLGEPIMQPDWNGCIIKTPVGQLALCQLEVTRLHSVDEVIDCMRNEYMAIVRMLCQMNIEFRIVYAHPDDIDDRVLHKVASLGCRMAGFPSQYPHSCTMFPRDFGVELPNVSLVNPICAHPTEKPCNKPCLASPYAEGGRILHRDMVAVISRRLPGLFGSMPAEMGYLVDAGMSVATIPNPACITVQQGHEDKFDTNAHIDRVSVLIESKKGDKNLIVDPRYCGAQTLPPETIAIARNECGKVQVGVIVPSRALQVPYSLNMVQFPDGRVLMTSGDDVVAEIVEDLVGSENLFLTEIPIRAHPAWVYAGIRCMIGEMPDIFFRNLDQPLYVAHNT